MIIMIKGRKNNNNNKTVIFSSIQLQCIRKKRPSVLLSFTYENIDIFLTNYLSIEKIG